MPPTGPELPPHLAKRKREVSPEDAEDARNGSRRSSSSGISTSSTPDGAEKRRRILGPTLPPASLDERPEAPPDPADDSTDSSSDDGFGPTLPPKLGGKEEYEERRRQETLFAQAAEDEKNTKPQREEWMLLPPQQDDLSSRVDPTKLRNRKFNSGKGAKAPVQKSGGDNALWTETPEQKRRRLQDEVMGVTQPATQGPAERADLRNRESEQATARRIQEYNERNRNKSLYDEHKKTVPREKEDDPSKRAFDKEKDIGGGMKIGHSKRKELVTKAAEFGQKFSGGKFL
ncbi:MAG: hypothetical protein M1825_002896 [Sarcosagium campestre]|nr:MAG: hypothetical protein M1825_002896 [Sarcosagium campestre]